MSMAIPWVHGERKQGIDVHPVKFLEALHDDKHVGLGTTINEA